MEKMAEWIVGSGGSVHLKAEQILAYAITILEHQMQTCVIITLLRGYLQNGHECVCLALNQ